MGERTLEWGLVNRAVNPSDKMIEGGIDEKKQPRLSYFDVVRIVLGSVLVVASFLKGFDLLTDPLAGYDVIGPRWLLIVLVGFEWGLGLWLLAGFHPRLTRWVAIACFSVFAGTTLMMALAGESSCGCFGRVRVSPWLTLSFDLAAVGALLSFPPVVADYPTVKSKSSRLRLVGLLTFALWVSVPWAIAAATIHGDKVVLDPETWVGKRFPLLGSIDIGHELAKGRWTIVLFRHNCSACASAIPRYEEMARKAINDPDVPRIALIEIPPYASSNERVVSSESPCKLGRLDESKVWSIATPTTISLLDRIVLPRVELPDKEQD